MTTGIVTVTAATNQPFQNKKRVWVLGLCVFVCMLLALHEKLDPCLLAVEPSYNTVSQQYVYQNIVIPRTSLWRRSHDNALVFCVCDFYRCLPVCCPHPKFEHLHAANCQNHTNTFSRIFNYMFDSSTIYVPQNMTYRKMIYFDEPDKIVIAPNGVLIHFNHKSKQYEYADPFHYCVVANVIKNVIDGTIAFTYNIYRRLESVEITNTDVMIMAYSLVSAFVSMTILAKYYNNKRIRTSLLGRLIMIMLIWPVFSSLSAILILFMPLPAVPCYVLAIGTYFVYLVHLNAILACAIEVTRLRLNYLAKVPMNTARRSFMHELTGILCWASLMMILVLVIDHVNDNELSGWKPNFGVDTCYLGVQSNRMPMLLYHIFPSLAILTATFVHLCMILGDKPKLNRLAKVLPRINFVNISQPYNKVPTTTAANDTVGAMGDGLNANNRRLVTNKYDKFTDEPNYMFTLFTLHVLMEFMTMMVLTIGRTDSNLFHFIGITLELVSNIVIWLRYDKDY